VVGAAVAAAAAAAAAAAEAAAAVAAAVAAAAPLTEILAGLSIDAKNRQCSTVRDCVFLLLLLRVGIRAVI
jgi:hypothetical protein